MLGFLFNILNDALIVLVIGLSDAFMRTAAEQYNADV